MIETLAFILGCAITAPVAFAMGLFAGWDRRVTHEPADISQALKRRVR